VVLGLEAADGRIGQRNAHDRQQPGVVGQCLVHHREAALVAVGGDGRRLGVEASQVEMLRRAQCADGAAQRPDLVQIARIQVGGQRWRGIGLELVGAAQGERADLRLLPVERIQTAEVAGRGAGDI
jgi:hypothetical protein